MCYSRHHSRTPPFCPIRGHLTSYHQPMAIEKQDLSKNFWWVGNTRWRKQLMTICTTRYPCWKIERILLMTFLSIWWKNYLLIYVLYILFIYIGSPMVWDWIGFLFNELCVFYPRALAHENYRRFFLSHVTTPFLSLHHLILIFTRHFIG